MSEWWLFRNTRIENVNEQHEIARKHLPDTTHWLGSEHNYFYIKCCDVTHSVYSDSDTLKGDISPRRPVQSGDTLYVANIYVLGGTLPTIQKTLKLLQDKQIHLRIPSLEYDDKDDTHDHELLSGTLSQIHNYRQSQPIEQLPGHRKAPGRPKRRISLMGLQRAEFNVIEQYCLHKTTERQAMKLLAGKLPDNKPITRYIFRKLVDEYRKMFPDSGEIDIMYKYGAPHHSPSSQAQYAPYLDR